jgi:hypothetical protein
MRICTIIFLLSEGMTLNRENSKQKWLTLGAQSGFETKHAALSHATVINPSAGLPVLATLNSHCCHQ